VASEGVMHDLPNHSEVRAHRRSDQNTNKDDIGDPCTCGTQSGLHVRDTSNCLADKVAHRNRVPIDIERTGPTSRW